MKKTGVGNLSGSMEDYLEAIHCIGERQAAVRVRDIAKHMDITMPSVSGALKSLEKQGLVNHAAYDWIALTPEGKRIAENVFRRHRVLREFLTVILGIDPGTAEHDACGMEHAVSETTLDRLVGFMEKRPRRARKGGIPRERR
jgi:DtxR family transcriptional regulator, Mn-dependent transcriptional regulator